MVPGYLPGKTARVTLTMPEDLLARIDAAPGSYERSGWIAEAAQARLAGEVERRAKTLAAGKFRSAGKIKMPSEFGLAEGKVQVLKTRRAKASGKKAKARARA